MAELGTKEPMLPLSHAQPIELLQQADTRYAKHSRRLRPVVARLGERFADHPHLERFDLLVQRPPSGRGRRLCVTQGEGEQALIDQGLCL